MKKTKKIIWLLFFLFMLIQAGFTYLLQNNANFLIKIKNYTPYIFIFSLIGVTLFVLTFMIHFLSGIKAKKQIAKIEEEKKDLKAKIFDMQEEKAEKNHLIPTPIKEKKEEENHNFI